MRSPNRRASAVFSADPSDGFHYGWVLKDPVFRGQIVLVDILQCSKRLKAIAATIGVDLYQRMRARLCRLNPAVGHCVAAAIAELAQQCADIDGIASRTGLEIDDDVSGVGRRRIDEVVLAAAAADPVRPFAADDSIIA